MIRQVCLNSDLEVYKALVLTTEPTLLNTSVGRGHLATVEAIDLRTLNKELKSTLGYSDRGKTLRKLDIESSIAMTVKKV